MADPIKQFKIFSIIPLELFGVDISITNATVALFVAVVLSVGVPYILLRKQSLAPGRLQALFEISMDMVSDTLTQYAHQMTYFPFVFSIFLFIISCNMIGLVPGFFTPTSHIIFTFSMAAIIYCSLIFIGILKKGRQFCRIFLPKSVPLYLAPLFVPIELVSFLSKPFSMAIRLFANMVAGHIVVKIFAGFVVSLVGFNIFLKPIALLPLLANIAVIGFEIAVAFIQAYVFTILSCIYINEILGEAH